MHFVHRLLGLAYQARREADPRRLRRERARVRGDARGKCVSAVGHGPSSPSFLFFRALFLLLFLLFPRPRGGALPRLLGWGLRGPAVSFYRHRGRLGLQAMARLLRRGGRGLRGGAGLLIGLDQRELCESQHPALVVVPRVGGRLQDGRPHVLPENRPVVHQGAAKLPLDVVEKILALHEVAGGRKGLRRRPLLLRGGGLLGVCAAALLAGPPEPEHAEAHGDHGRARLVQEVDPAVVAH
mmetsp:Transcript_50243/g.143668  ORF Transcript_50243/g.143668 Transcript_50243/m.143668 type:complete len:240 (-) Transcript_50243:241-960(-)